MVWMCVCVCVCADLCWTGVPFKVSPWFMPSVTKKRSGSTAILTKALHDFTCYMNEWRMFYKTKWSTSITSSSCIILFIWTHTWKRVNGYSLNPVIDHLYNILKILILWKREPIIMGFLTRVSSLGYKK